MKIFKLLLTFVILLSAVGCGPKEEMNLLKDSLTLEYGSQLSESVKDYLDNTDEYLEEVTLELPQTDTDYLSVGEHEIVLRHKDEEGMVKVIVQDTTKPVLKDVKDKYEVENGQTLDHSQFKADDLNDTVVSVADEHVDYKKSGDYKVKITAEDKYHNKAEKEITVTVREEVKIKEEKEETATTVNKKPSSTSSSSSSASKTENNKNNTATTANKKPSSSVSNKTESQKQDNDKGETIFTYEDPVIDMATHVHDGPAVANKYFDDPDELDEWAMNYRIEQCESGNWIGGAYGVSDCKCGMMYINMFY